MELRYWLVQDCRGLFKEKGNEKNRNGPLSRSCCSQILVGTNFLLEPVHRISDTYLPKSIWHEELNDIFLIIGRNASSIPCECYHYAFAHGIILTLRNRHKKYMEMR